MNRTNDIRRISLAAQHNRLTMATNVRQQLDTVLVAHQHLGVIHPLERMEVAHLGHHQLVADVLRAVANSTSISISWMC